MRLKISCVIAILLIVVIPAVYRSENKKPTSSLPATPAFPPLPVMRAATQAKLGPGSSAARLERLGRLGRLGLSQPGIQYPGRP